MRVLLIQPPISDFYDTKIRTYPLGLLYLGSRIKDIAEVKLLDLRTGYKPKIIEDIFFSELKEFYRDNRLSPFTFFSRYYYFGIDKSLISKKIAEFKPDMVCISSLFSTYFYDVIDIAKEVKKINKDIIVVSGGNHPTIFPEKVLRYKEIDFVIRGEGETPLNQLIKAIRNKNGFDEIKGLCYKKDDKLILSPPNIEEDINILPERTLLDSSRYRIGKSKYAFMITTRGCPKRCNFCGRPDLPFRKIDLKIIEKDMENCHSSGVTHIDFEDDMLTFDKTNFKKVLEISADYNFTISAMNGIYPENLDKDILDKMYRAGFRRLNISLVDISEKVIKNQNRFKMNLTGLIKLLENSEFMTEVHFIIGLPSQKEEDVLDTLIFLMEHRCLPAPSIFYLAPGSKIYNDYQKKEEIDLRALRSSYMFEISGDFTRKKIYTFLLVSRFINFVKKNIDRNPHMNNLSELSDISEEYKYLLELLYKEKKFFFIDTHTNMLIEEPVEKDLIELFFKKSKNRFIKGFKSHKRIIFDL
ncbi:MAG: B12-binding domain-containing radical SAM protein [Proteobacteria bacterium]|nr:B12-binding domain-containing radical SAM protein [Pseudomonadota bacterium]